MYVPSCTLGHESLSAPAPFDSGAVVPEARSTSVAEAATEAATEAHSITNDSSKIEAKIRPSMSEEEEEEEESDRGPAVVGRELSVWLGVYVVLH